MALVSSLRDRAERAAAAELLAPAEGVAALIDGAAYSDDERSRLALHFGVDELLIDHQIENQLYEDF